MPQPNPSTSMNSSQGFWAWKNAFSLGLRMWKFVILTLISFHIVTFFIVCWVALSSDFLPERFAITPVQRIHFGEYYKAMFVGEFQQVDITLEDGNSTITTSGDIAEKVLSPDAKLVMKRVKIAFWTSLLVWGFLPVIIRYWRRKAEAETRDTFIKGARLVNEKELATILQDQYRCRYKISEDVMIPVEFEPKHILVVGKAGEGKTVGISNLISQVLEKVSKNPRMRAVIYSYKGDFPERFFIPDDHLLFNPFSPNCVDWNFFNEVENIEDITTLAESLIPPAGDGTNQTFFSDTASKVFAGLLAYANSNGHYRNNAELYRISNEPPDKLVEYLEATQEGKNALNFINYKGATGQVAGIVASMARFTGAFRYIKELNGSFSFRRWVRNPGQKRVLFLVNNPNIKAAMSPLLSQAIELMSNELISMPDIDPTNDDGNTRLYFFLDEFTTLMKMDKMVDILKLGRSKGASVCIGIQDFGDLHEIYGQNRTTTILNQPDTRLVMRVEDPTVAKYFSDNFGQGEFQVTNQTTSTSIGQQHFQDAASMSKTDTLKPIVLPSEITNLPTRTGYLKVGANPVAKVKIPLLKSRLKPKPTEG